MHKLSLRIYCNLFVMLLLFYKRRNCSKFQIKFVIFYFRMKIQSCYVLDMLIKFTDAICILPKQLHIKSSSCIFQIMISKIIVQTSKNNIPGCAQSYEKLQRAIISSSDQFLCIYKHAEQVAKNIKKARWTWKILFNYRAFRMTGKVLVK